MIRIHTTQDLPKLQHLKNKKKILVRFIMDGCYHCENSQSNWDDAERKTKMSADDAIAEIESSFLEDFKKVVGRNLNVEGYPSILLIHPNGIHIHNTRDTSSIVNLIKSMSPKKSKRKIKRKRKTRLNTF
jgi:hypothetical protein